MCGKGLLFRGPFGQQRWPPLRGACPVTWGLSSSLGAQEFEIELEGSQTLRILCYEKCYHKTRLAKEDGGESTDRIVGKGQAQVRWPLRSPWAPRLRVLCALPV